jgi:hypothetical protein
MLYMIAIPAAAWAQVHANGHTGMGIGGPRPHGQLSSHGLKTDQSKGNQEAATSIKHVCIDQLLVCEVTSQERGAMKTPIKDTTLSDMEAIYLASVILGVAWLFV